MTNKPKIEAISTPLTATREEVFKAARAPIASAANTGKICGVHKPLWGPDIDAIADEITDAILSLPEIKQAEKKYG